MLFVFKRRTFPKKAFSLLEVAFVLGLLTFLALVLLPRLSFQKGTSEDAGAQSSIEAALDAQETARTRTGEFVDVSTQGASGLEAINPDLFYKAGNFPSTAKNIVSIKVVTDPLDDTSTIGMAALGGNSTCWYTKRSFAAATGAPTVIRAYANADTNAPCTGEKAVSLVPGAYDAQAGAAWTRPLEVR